MAALDTIAIPNISTNNNTARYLGEIVKDSNGNLYTVLQTSTTQIGVFKSTDDGSTWSEIDSANKPAAIPGGGIAAVSWWSDEAGTNNLIYIATLSNAYASGMDQVRDLEAHTFGCSDKLISGADTWITTNDAVNAAYVEDSGGGGGNVRIVRRNTGSNRIVIAYTGPSYAAMGSDWQAAYVAYGSVGGTWTNTRLDSETLANATNVFGQLSGSDDADVHITWRSRGRTFRGADDSLSTIVTMHTSYSVVGERWTSPGINVSQNSGAEDGFIRGVNVISDWRINWIELDASLDVQDDGSTTNPTFDPFGTLPPGETQPDIYVLHHDPTNGKVWAWWVDDDTTPNSIHGISAPDGDTYTVASWDTSTTELVSDSDVPTPASFKYLVGRIWDSGGSTYLGMWCIDHDTNDTAYFFRYTLASGSPSGDGVINQASTVVATGTKDAEGAASISQAQTVVATGEKAASSDPSISQGHTVTATGTALEIRSGDAAINQGHTVVATGTKNAQSDPAISQPSTVASTGTKQASSDPTIAQPSTVASDGTSARSSDPAINQASTVVATGSVGSDNRSGDAAISQPSTVVATGEKAASNDAAIAQGHTVEATGTKNAQSDPAISQPSTVASTGTKGAHSDPSIDQASTVAATGSTAESKHGDAAISQGHTVEATGTKDASGDASIAQPSTVAGTGSSQRSGDATISQPSTVAATGSVSGIGPEIHGDGAITIGHTVVATGHKGGVGSATVSVSSAVAVFVTKNGHGDGSITLGSSISASSHMFWALDTAPGLGLTDEQTQLGITNGRNPDGDSAVATVRGKSDVVTSPGRTT